MTREPDYKTSVATLTDVGVGVGERVQIEADPYLAAVGARVRELRASRRLSRRALAEQAGLSQRFIAQLEAGYGNISVKRLKALVDALDGDLAEVVSGIPAPTDTKAAALARRISRAPDALKARIIRLLESAELGADDRIRARRVALVGLRGAGKSTLGRMLGERLGLDFVELNAEISRASGLGVDEIFALYGDDGYRRLEQEQLVRIARRDNLVLAVAGGIVDHREAYRFLKENFVTVWLKARPEEHMDRVIAQGDSRPMSGSPDAMADLRRILAAREASYAEADATLDTSSRQPEESAAELADLVGALLRDKTAAPNAPTGL
jgi:XRE family aerobic/anaerobic benzoate catabolism transcriptional regulator